MQSRKQNILYQLFFILLIYVEYPLMIVLVISGVSKMDIYHILFIVFFTVYTLFPVVMNRASLALLLYSDAFVLIKYLYSLLA